MPFNAMAKAAELVKSAKGEDPDVKTVDDDTNSLNKLIQDNKLQGDPLSYTTVKMVQDAGVKDKYVAQEIVNLVKKITGTGK